MARRRVIVDGYNVIKQDPDLSELEKRGLALARQGLLARLRSHRFLRGDEIIVVFDGDRERPTVRDEGGIRIIFSQADEPADQVILELADIASDETPVLVLSDDLQVRKEAVQLGATVKGARRRKRREPRSFDDRWEKEVDHQDDWPEEEKKEGRKKTSPRRPDGKRPRGPEPVDEEFFW
ncbi:MAG: NYN domain-containing protein [Chloroflexi bacterium]|nr:NYN domain-containing protein [Chloroflexota bacterium]MBU1747927.1 NYN domain-containing protein [Chloroflexota bacterium]